MPAAMSATYSHTCIVAHDVERLASFYSEVFGFVPAGPERVLAGEWLERGTGLPGASFRGVHLRLPSGGDDGPTLEIFTVQGLADAVPPAVDRAGLMHIALAVQDIEATFARLLEAGGGRLGEVSRATIEGVGTAEFVYARDPEGNVVELQQWRER
jgi:glyoxylase I family protein